MAYTVTKDYGDHQSISGKLENLLNSASGEVINCGIIKVGNDFYMCWIVEETT